jgi:quinol monooxygenase YgiN|tara:strand:+ start:442 stop:864 length:423 start_codon:yes stop_codon:yes gene_type:complete
MKKLLLLTLLVPSFLMAMHHKSEPIIFYLDMDIAEGKSENVQEFVDYLVKTVKKTEPKTMYYKYWISEDKTKVSLMEVYHSNEDALFHMNAFDKASHKQKFIDTFVITNFQVMGDTNDELKEAMSAFTKDHRSLMNGFKR